MIGELAALGTAVLWTVSAVLYKEALFRTKPISANIVRCLITSIILIVFLAATGKFWVLTGLPVYTVVLASLSGVIGLGVGDTLYMASLKLIGVARAVPITCIYPLFNLLLAIFLQGETVILQVLLGATTIVLGIWLLSQEKEAATSKLQKESLVKGVVYAFTTAIVWAVSIMIIDMAVTPSETSSLDHVLAINTLRISATAAFLLASAPITDRKFGFLKMQKKRVAALVSGGLVALAFGWFLLILSLIYIPESQAVPISSSTPLFATISGIVFLRERVTAKNGLGSVMIVIGICLIFLV